MKEKNKTDKTSAPMNEIPNLPKRQTHWSTSRASAFHNYGSTPTSSLNPASPHFYSSWFGSQMWNRPIQYGSLYQSCSFSNYPMMAARVGQSSLLASANTIQRTFTENNMHFKNHSYKISQPTSNVTLKGKENERRPSIQGTNLKRSSVTSESKEKSVKVNDNKNDGGSKEESKNTKEQRKRKAEHTSSKIVNMKSIKELLAIPSTKQQQSRMMPRTDNSEANRSNLNQNLHIDLNASSANSLLEEQSDDTKVQRKRKAMNKSSKRPKRKIMKLKDIFSNIVTSIENCNSTQDKTNIASNHFEVNPTERNQKLSTKLSATNPQLAKEESDEEKEQRRRQSKKKSAKRSRMKMKMERERLNASIKNLDVENAALRKELHDLIDGYDKMRENNDSLLDELNEMFGKEKVMEVFNMQSAESDADDDQNSNDR